MNRHFRWQWIWRNGIDSYTIRCRIYFCMYYCSLCVMVICDVALDDFLSIWYVFDAVFSYSIFVLVAKKSGAVARHCTQNNKTVQGCICTVILLYIMRIFYYNEMREFFFAPTTLVLLCWCSTEHKCLVWLRSCEFFIAQYGNG